MSTDFLYSGSEPEKSDEGKDEDLKKNAVPKNHIYRLEKILIIKSLTTSFKITFYHKSNTYYVRLVQKQMY